MPESEFDLVTISFRCYKGQQDLIKRAAEKLGAENESEHMRDVLVSASAKTLGLPVPTFPPIVRGRGGSLIAQAAVKMGLSQEQLLRRGGHLLAAQVLGLMPEPQHGPKSSESGTRPAVRNTGSNRR